MRDQLKHYTSKLSIGRQSRRILTTLLNTCVSRSGIGRREDYKQRQVNLKHEAIRGLENKRQYKQKMFVGLNEYPPYTEQTRLQFIQHP